MRIFFIIAMIFSTLAAETTAVKDLKNNLIWEDTPHVSNVKITHPRAKTYCSELTLNNFNDWRMPTIKELLTIVDFKQYSPALIKAFSYVEKESFYWTTSPYGNRSDEFWGINFKDGASSNAAEYYDRYVRCVRSIK